MKAKEQPDKDLTWDQFLQVEMRVGAVLEAARNEKARKPAYVLRIDFGEHGVLTSSAQITDLYAPQDLVGRQVIAVVNFPPKRIAGVKSECLVLGSVAEDGTVTLITPDKPVKNGSRIA